MIFMARACRAPCALFGGPQSAGRSVGATRNERDPLPGLGPSRQIAEAEGRTTSPIRSTSKGWGKIGIVGRAAVIANAIYHATGKRVRDLPIMFDTSAR